MYGISESAEELDEDLSEKNPITTYAKAKWEAEKALWEICKQTGLEGVIIRAPLVCGPGGKGNLRSLIK